MGFFRSVLRARNFFHFFLRQGVAIPCSTTSILRKGHFFSFFLVAIPSRGVESAFQKSAYKFEKKGERRNILHMRIMTSATVLDVCSWLRSLLSVEPKSDPLHHLLGWSEYQELGMQKRLIPDEERLPMETDVSKWIDTRLWQETPQREAIGEGYFEPDENQDLIATEYSAQRLAEVEQLRQTFQEELRRSRERLKRANLRVERVQLHSAPPVKGLRLVEGTEPDALPWSEEQQVHHADPAVLLDEAPVFRQSASQTGLEPEQNLSVHTHIHGLKAGWVRIKHWLVRWLGGRP